MVTLRKFWGGFWPFVWHVIAAQFTVQIADLHRSHAKRLKYPHVLLGILFLALLIALLFILPESTGSTAPYLNIQEASNQQVESSAAGPAYPNALDTIPLPVTGM